MNSYEIERWLKTYLDYSDIQCRDALDYAAQHGTMILLGICEDYPHGLTLQYDDYAFKLIA